MQGPTGFIDLRVGHGTGGGIGDDSVWPSFTDVMTVIVMIFLMALVIIMLRNFELNRELVSSVSDKEATLLVNQSLAQEKSRIESLLGKTVDEKGMLELALTQERENIASLTEDQNSLEQELQTLLATRAELEKTNAELAADKQVSLQEVSRLVDVERMLNSKLTNLGEQLAELEFESTQQITALSEEKQSLGEKLDTVSKQLGEVKNWLAQSQVEKRGLSEEILGLAEQNKDTEEKFSIANEEKQTLSELIKQRELEISELQSRANSSGKQFRSLQDEYDSLDQAYRKLIRPARSTAGKYIVEIRVEKLDDQLQYKVREPNQSEPVSIAKSQLDQLLRDLKAKHGKALYTKIIIPQNSKLSHSEAWRFTQEMLRNFDYYSQ